MAFKCFLLMTTIAVVHGAMSVSSPFAVGSPYAGMVNGVPVIGMASEIDPYNSKPQYHYGYNVQDASTGDSKTQQETREGDVVRGSYSLIEPDGTRRIVEYTADPINGFNAVVHREPAVVKMTVPSAPITLARPFAVAHAPLRLAMSPYRAMGLAYH